MRTYKLFMTLVGFVGILMSTYSCADWGEADPPAGNQVFPTREAFGPFTFKGLTSLADAPFLTSTVGNATVVYDDQLYTEVLTVAPGTVTMANPLTASKLQVGAGVCMWVKTDDADMSGRIFSFSNESGDSVLSFTTSGKLESSFWQQPVDIEFDSAYADTLLKANEWHFMAVQINNNACTVSIDGQQVGSAAYDRDDAMTAFLNNAPYFVIGDAEHNSLSVDKISLVRNNMTANDMKRPNVTKVITLPDPVYFNDFSSVAGLTIVGAGSFVTDQDSNFGQVFQNAASTTPRQNYLLLPEDVLSHSAETEQMTIGFWVNAANAGSSAAYQWAPLFMAYGAAPVNNENTWPMLACQYRGVLQLNCAGWTDYTDAQNTEGVNTLYHNDLDWLADHEWHYYTVVYSGENAKVYFDGELKNEWEMDGVNNTQRGLYTNGGDLKYICLGGNQAWNWNDNDPGFAFDDFVVYDEALSEEQIQQVIAKKAGGSVLPVDLPEAYYRNTFDSADGLTIVGGGTFLDAGDKHGKVFQNVTSTAPRQNYLLLPEDLLTHSAETQQLTISVWVNAKNAGESATYMWAPLLTAYAQKNDENTWPMLACQYRGVLQLNCAGWTDYTDAQNTAGVNTLYHNETDWLVDGQWHLYTVVFSGENAKVYFDGEVKNEWNMDGVNNTQAGLFSNGGDLKYICLGGNQAWNWNDNDPGFQFDDIMFFDTALTPAHIKALMSVYE